MSGFIGNIHKTVTTPSEGAVASYVTVAAADKLTLDPSRPIQIVRWGFIATTTVNDGANALKLTGNFRPTAGSSAGQTVGSTTTVAATTGYNAAGQPALFMDTAGGSLTLTAGAAQVVAGQGVYHTMNPQKPSSGAYYPVPSTFQVADTQLQINPGQEFAIVSAATAPAAGAGVFFVEYRELPFVGDSSVGTAGAGGPANAINNMVRFNS